MGESGHQRIPASRSTASCAVRVRAAGDRLSHHRQNTAGARSGKTWSPYVPSYFRLQRDFIESLLIITTANHYTSYCMYYL